MRIQRYIAKDMRSALAQVREAMGPEAVILSTGTIGDQVEVVAAIDVEVAREFAAPRGAAPADAERDHRAHAGCVALPRSCPKRWCRRSPLRSLAVAAPRRCARRAGARSPPSSTASSPTKSKTCAACSKRSSRRSRGTTCRAARRCRPRCSRSSRSSASRRISPARWRARFRRTSISPRRAASRWRPSRAPCRSPAIAGSRPAAVVAFAGPAGAGKTTLLAKLAARWVLRHGPRRVALVSADAVRIGAHEQMHMLGRLLGVTAHTVYDVAELPELLEACRGQQLVLIDTAGASPRDPDLARRLRLMNQAQSQHRNFAGDARPAPRRAPSRKP